MTVVVSGRVLPLPGQRQSCPSRISRCSGSRVMSSARGTTSAPARSSTRATSRTTTQDDLLLRGTCHPGNEPAPGLLAAIPAWATRPSLRVVGQRVWKDGLLDAISNPVPFTSMPITFENAFGGPSYPTHKPRRQGSRDSPSCPTSRGFPGGPRRSRARRDRPKPAGFGSGLSPNWLNTSGKRGTASTRPGRRRARPSTRPTSTGPLQRGPPDQQLPGYLRGDERIEFEFLHPKATRLWPLPASGRASSCAGRTVSAARCRCSSTRWPPISMRSTFRPPLSGASSGEGRSARGRAHNPHRVETLFEPRPVRLPGGAGGPGPQSHRLLEGQAHAGRGEEAARGRRGGQEDAEARREEASAKAAEAAKNAPSPAAPTDVVGTMKAFGARLQGRRRRARVEALLKDEAKVAAMKASAEGSAWLQLAGTTRPRRRSKSSRRAPLLAGSRPKPSVRREAIAQAKEQVGVRPGCTRGPGRRRAGAAPPPRPGADLFRPRSARPGSAAPAPQGQARRREPRPRRSLAASLGEADLENADLSGARLSQTTFVGARARGAKFENATLDQTMFVSRTCPAPCSPACEGRCASSRRP